MLNIELVEKQLKKRAELQPYQWNRKQTDNFDLITRDIYKIRSYNKLLERFDSENDNVKNYAFNRWLNFWSAKSIEQFFAQNDSVKKENNEFHRTIDFYINGVSFDHKTSIIPKSFFNKIEKLNTNKVKQELVEWLYANQSQEKRKHYSNRIFVILVDKEKPSESWKMKAELSIIKNSIDNYMDDLVNNKKRFIYNKEKNFYAGIIIVEK